MFLAQRQDGHWGTQQLQWLGWLLLPACQSPMARRQSVAEIEALAWATVWAFPLAGWAWQQPCRATLASHSTGTLPSPRDVWLALYPANFCFQTQLHLSVETHTVPFVLLGDITHGCSCVSPSFLSADVGIKKPVLSPKQNLLAMLPAGAFGSQTFFTYITQDTPQSPLGCFRLRWSTSHF